jgi:hypothetical protein
MATRAEGPLDQRGTDREKQERRGAPVEMPRVLDRRQQAGEGPEASPADPDKPRRPQAARGGGRTSARRRAAPPLTPPPPSSAEPADLRRQAAEDDARRSRLLADEVEDTKRELESVRTERRQAENLERQLALQQGLQEGKQWATLLKRRSYIVGGAAVAVGFAGLTAVILAFGADLQIPTQTRWIVAVSSAVVAWLSLVGALALPGLMEARREQRELEAKARENVAESADEIDNAKDLVQLIKANRKQMAAYDVLAQAQAKNAFRNSQIAMAAGLIVLLAGAAVAISAPSVATKVAAASLTAIGGAVSGFIAQTFLRTYSDAVKQLNFYFQQPLITSYVLTAQRLAGELSSKERCDEALDGLIKRTEALVRPWNVWGSGEEQQKPKRTPRRSRDKPAPK